MLDLPVLLHIHCSGADIRLSSVHTRVTHENVEEFIRVAINYRLHEFDAAAKAVREGMARVRPVFMTTSR